MLPLTILHKSLGLLKISYQSWQPYSTIGMSSISTSASSGIINIEPDNINTNSNSIDVKITLIVKNIFKLTKYVSYLLFIPLLRSSILRNLINLI